MTPDYSYQLPLVEKTVAALYKHKQAVLAACPGAGKTHMAKAIIEEMQKRKPGFRTIILTHGQILLRDQWGAFFTEEKFPFGTIVESRMTASALRDNATVLAIPQTLGNLRELKVDLLICDEGHQRFLQGQVQRVIKAVKPTYQLVLTGTPSPFLGQAAWPVIGITIEELLGYGVIADPLIEIVEMNYQYSVMDYDWNRMDLRGDKLSLEGQDQSLDSLLPQLIDKLTHRNRDNPEKFQWNRKPDNWADLVKQLRKTMIICHSQRHALSIDAYFKAHGVKTALSIYSQGTGTTELESFTTDPCVPIFIVVNRGILGFNYTELFNIIDLSLSLNVNRLFQQLCRVVRPSKEDTGQRKIYIKATNAKLAKLTYFVMSFTVALCSKEYYYSYHTGFEIRNIPIDIKFFNSIGETVKENSGETFPELPQLFTFEEVIAKGKDGTKTIAYTNFQTVLNKVRRKNWVLEEVLRLAKKCKSRVDFYKRHKGAYEFLLRNKRSDILNQLFGKQANLKHTKESVIELIAKCSSSNELRKRFPGAYTWIKRTDSFDLMEPLLARGKRTGIFTTTSGLLEEFLADPDYEAFPNGTIFYKGRVKGHKHKKGYYSIRYKNGNLGLNRIMWEKFHGPIPEGRMVCLKDRGQPPSVDNLECLTALEVATREREKTRISLTKVSGHLVSNAKVNYQLAEQIRADHVAGFTYPVLIAKYNLSKSSISYIINRRTWKAPAKELA